MGVLLQVKAKSLKGRNRLREHGILWRLTFTRDKVEFDNKPGPWHHVESLKNPQYGRWIHHNDDPDFVIVDRIEAKDSREGI